MNTNQSRDLYVPTNGDIVEFNHDTRLGYGVAFAAGTEGTYLHDTDNGHVVIVSCPIGSTQRAKFSDIYVTVMYDDGITLVESA